MWTKQLFGVGGSETQSHSQCCRRNKTEVWQALLHVHSTPWASPSPALNTTPRWMTLKFISALSAKPRSSFSASPGGFLFCITNIYKLEPLIPSLQTCLPSSVSVPSPCCSSQKLKTFILDFYLDFLLPLYQLILLLCLQNISQVRPLLFLHIFATLSPPPIISHLTLLCICYCLPTSLRPRKSD